MAKRRTAREQQAAEELLTRDHTLNGGILFGLDGYIIEIQARAIEVLSFPQPVTSVTKISGMPRGAITESLDRISGAFAKIGIPKSDDCIAS
jgi:magnesium chelatase family protein